MPFGARRLFYGTLVDPRKAKERGLSLLHIHTYSNRPYLIFVSGSASFVFRDEFLAIVIIRRIGEDIYSE